VQLLEQCIEETKYDEKSRKVRELVAKIVRHASAGSIAI